MSHVWIRESATPSADWSAVLLAPDSRPVHPLVDLRRVRGDAETFVVLGTSAVRVNGAPLDVGIRVLRDRDELRVDGCRVYFSTESLAELVPFPGADRPVFCARCKLEISAGTPAVRCPACTVWHHQTDRLPCFTYRETCSTCPQPSALDAGYRWSPEEL